MGDVLSFPSPWPYPAAGGLKAEWTAAMRGIDKLTLRHVQGRLAPAGERLLAALHDLADELQCRLQLGARNYCAFGREPVLAAKRQAVAGAFQDGYDFETVMAIEVT